jgi:hypothetical protein
LALVVGASESRSRLSFSPTNPALPASVRRCFSPSFSLARSPPPPPPLSPSPSAALYLGCIGLGSFGGREGKPPLLLSPFTLHSFCASSVAPRASENHPGLMTSAAPCNPPRRSSVCLHRCRRRTFNRIDFILAPTTCTITPLSLSLLLPRSFHPL